MSNTFEDEVKDVKQICCMIEGFKNKYGYDPFHNYHFREMTQKLELMGLYDLKSEDITLKPPDGNHDWACNKLSVRKGEMKAMWCKAKQITKKNCGEICFDKQNDAVRRSDIFNYDALYFSSMRRNMDIELTMGIIGSENMKKIHPLFRKYQKQKIIQIQECERINKRLPRDDIRIPVLEVIEALEDGDMILSYKRKKISKSEFLDLIQ